MILGTLLLATAAALLLVALGLSLLDLKQGGRDPQHGARAVAALFAAFAALGAALFTLAAAFLAGDLSIHYVWANSDLRYSWFQRLSGLWVGRAGSLLLWATFALGLWCIEEARHARALRKGEREAARAAQTAHAADPTGRRPLMDLLADAETIRRVARPIALGVVFLMLLVVLNARPFLPSLEADLLQAPYGRGINPQLLIFYNAIHPPVVFLGYAATLLPTLFAVAHLATGRPGWVGSARRWGHVAFFTLTIGVALGTLWAYIALGWGGYWDWDPVEVASLIPWLLVTAFLHAAYRHDGKGQFALAAPLLGALLFAGSLFSTLVVRSGVWVSLHSFLGEGDGSDAWGRFLAAFDAQWEVRLFSLLILAFIATIVFTLPAHARRIDAAAAGPDAIAPRVQAAQNPPSRTDRLLARLTLGNLFVVGVLLLVLLTTVTVTLLIVGVNGYPSSAVREEIYTERTGPIALSAVTVMGVAVAIGTLAKRTILALVAGALAVGAAAALLLPAVWALALAAPVVALAAALAATRIVLAWRRMERRAAVRFTGIHLVHVGVALVILGHGFVSTFEHTEQPVEMRVGDTRTSGPYELTLLDLEARDDDGNGRIDRVTAIFRVHEDGRDRGTTTTGFRFYDFQSHYKPTVGLLRGIGRDIYFAPAGIHDPTQGWIFGNLPLPEQGMREARDVDAITVRVSTLPFINLVWGGAALMIAGSGALAASSWLAAARSPAHRAERVVAPERTPRDAGARPAASLERLGAPADAQDGPGR